MRSFQTWKISWLFFEKTQSTLKSSCLHGYYLSSKVDMFVVFDLSNCNENVFDLVTIPSKNFQSKPVIERDHKNGNKTIQNCVHFSWESIVFNGLFHNIYFIFALFREISQFHIHSLPLPLVLFIQQGVISSCSKK